MFKKIAINRTFQRGQSVVEFSLVALLFFLLIFGIIVSSFWSLDVVSASNAVTNGARDASIAMSFPGTGTKAIASTNSGATAICDQIVNNLKEIMFGTTIKCYVPSIINTPCDNLNQYEQNIKNFYPQNVPPYSVQVCVTYLSNHFTATNPYSGFPIYEDGVQVSVVGTASSLLPSVFSCSSTPKNPLASCGIFTIKIQESEILPVQTYQS